MREFNAPLARRADVELETEGIRRFDGAQDTRVMIDQDTANRVTEQSRIHGGSRNKRLVGQRRP